MYLSTSDALKDTTTGYFCQSMFAIKDLSGIVHFFPREKISIDERGVQTMKVR